MEAAGVPFEILDAAETMHRWPQFRLHDATTSVYQADGGIAPAAACNAAHVALARAYGATLLENHPVTSIDARGDDISVIAGGQRFSCSKLIVAVDAWTNDMLAWLGLRIPLTVTQEQVTYFASPRSDAFALERFPIWIWMDDPSFYGFPVYGEPGPKIAQDVGGREVTPTTRTFDPDREALERVVKWLERYLPDALGPVIYTKTCLYTMPPDRDFIIDAVPDHDNVFVAVGAAHAFKFAALLGRILEDLAVGGTTTYDIEPFAVKRPALTDPEAVKSFLV
jgi:sarcosine oxidase